MNRVAHWSGLSEDAAMREIALLVLADRGRTMQPEPEHVFALAALQAEDES